MAGSGAVAVVRLAVLAVLARRLSSSVFGVMAMSTVVTGFAAATIDVGFGSAVVQRDRLSAGQLWWVFKFDLVLSLGLWAACAAGSPTVARFFHEPQAGPVLAASAAILPLSATALVPRALLMRRLEFRKLAVCDVCEAITNGGLSVALALVGCGVWSLVAGSLAGGAAAAAVLTALSPWRPAPVRRTEDHRALLGFGAAVTLMASLFYWTERVDNLVVGRLLGAQALGLYVVAFNLAIMIAGQLSVGTRVVAFPVFAAIQDDRRLLAAAYRRALRWSAALAFPCCALSAALAPQLVSVLLGDRWVSAALPFRLLLAVGAMRALYGFSGPMLRAIGRPRVELALQGFLFLGVGVASVWGARAGVNGVAAAVTAFVFLAGGPVFVAVGARATGLALSDVLLPAIAPAFAAGLAGSAALAATRGTQAFALLASPPLPLAMGLAVGLFAYLAGLRAFAPDLLAEAREHFWLPGAGATPVLPVRRRQTPEEVVR
jgi:PST family polysaccharide transporter